MENLELIRAQTPDFWERWYLLEQEPTRLRTVLVNHNNLADRLVRQSIQVSDLSAFDGRVLAYRGVDE